MHECVQQELEECVCMYVRTYAWHLMKHPLECKWQKEHSHRFRGEKQKETENETDRRIEKTYMPNATEQ